MITIMTISMFLKVLGLRIVKIQSFANISAVVHEVSYVAQSTAFTYRSA